QASSCAEAAVGAERPARTSRPANAARRTVRRMTVSEAMGRGRTESVVAVGRRQQRAGPEDEAAGTNRVPWGFRPGKGDGSEAGVAISRVIAPRAEPGPTRPPVRERLNTRLPRSNVQRSNVLTFNLPTFNARSATISTSG